MWFDLKGDERINLRCATDGCGGQPTYRLEADGVGSNYCSGCRMKIERQKAKEDARNFGTGFTREWPDGRVEHIPPDEIVMHGNAIHHTPKT